MPAASQLRPALSERAAPTARSSGRLHLIQGSFSTRKVARKFPMLGSFHRAVDGALIGVLMAVAMMSAFTLHWRYLWTNSFTKLENTRELSYKLTESTALLERHLLQRSSLPLSMVPTKADNLLYLDSPEKDRSRLSKNISFELFMKKSFAYSPANHGY